MILILKMLKKNIIIYQSNKVINISKNFENDMIYIIGSGKINSPKLINVNNDYELNNLAEAYRDQYVNWIYKQNQIFLKNKVIFKKASLFFFTDFSSKRSELSHTYNYFINTKQIEKIINEQKIEKITLVDCDKCLISMIKSIEGNYIFEVKREKRTNTKFLFIKTLAYFVKAFLIAVNNIFKKKDYDVDESKIFISRYPLHFVKDNNDRVSEDKYTSMVSSNQKYAVSILTDGFHQNVSLFSYLRLEKELDKNKFYLIDRHITLFDLFLTILVSLKFYFKWKKMYKNNFNLSSISITDSILQDLNFSFYRVIRLILLYRCTEKFFQKVKTKEVIYYLHEYPYGRMITAILKKYSIKHTAMQHGPASFRKLVYFLSKEETVYESDYYNSVPMPDHLLAEDEHSKKIYNYANYRNVEVMNEIFRLNYLKNIKIKKKKFVLITPGLHDGDLLLSKYYDIIKNDVNEKFLLKPHPRANNIYLKKYNLKNLTISGISIDKLLCNAKKVVCTYSSVGYEAKVLGIDVEMININGIINESPLGDANFNLTRQ